MVFRFISKELRLVDLWISLDSLTMVNLSIELDLLLFCMFGLHGIIWYGIYL
jgi:hypothetical protein